MCPHSLAMLGKGQGWEGGKEQGKGGRGSERGQGHTHSFPVPPKEDRLKEQTRNPLSLGEKKRFRDNGGVKHSRTQLGKETLRGWLNL